ncbi:MAG: TSUP family transporter [Methylococcales bacterium]
MSPDIMLAVVGTAIIQSIFGVGVLLFGTPLLLLLGYEFIDSLIILLPISISINLFQIIQHYSLIDRKFYKNILIYTIPFVVLFLFLIASNKININLIIGCFLIFVALKSYSKKIESVLGILVKYERSYLAAMGVIHGLTNLGGSLLTAIVHGKAYSKDVTRVTVAAAYATFAVFQIITLLFSVKSYDGLFTENMMYLTVALMVYVWAEAMFYVQIDNAKYSKIFAVFLFVSGVLLIGKSI